MIEKDTIDRLKETVPYQLPQLFYQSAVVCHRIMFGFSNRAHILLRQIASLA